MQRVQQSSKRVPELYMKVSRRGKRIDVSIISARIVVKK